jgi:hypothetical protein
MAAGWRGERQVFLQLADSGMSYGAVGFRTALGRARERLAAARTTHAEHGGRSTMKRHAQWIRWTPMAVGVALVWASSTARAQTGGVYDLSWNSIQGGGGVSSGGVYEISGEIGLGAAGTVMAGPYALGSGFWPVPPGQSCAADLNGDGSLTVNDFLAFLQFFGTVDPRADFDHSGAVNLQDFLAYLQAYAVGCP